METNLLEWASYGICLFQQIMDVLERSIWWEYFLSSTSCLLELADLFSIKSIFKKSSSGKIRRVKYFLSSAATKIVSFSQLPAKNKQTDFGPSYFVRALGRIWPFLHTYLHLVNCFRVIFIALVNLVSTLLKWITTLCYINLRIDLLIFTLFL